jgi:hypothetical protein
MLESFPVGKSTRGMNHCGNRLSLFQLYKYSQFLSWRLGEKWRIVFPGNTQCARHLQQISESEVQQLQVVAVAINDRCIRYFLMDPGLGGIQAVT